MAFTHTKQYRPITIQQTSADDPCSTRSVLDLADSINNYVFHAGKYKYMGTAFVPAMICPQGTTGTTEKVILNLGKFWWNNAYSNLRFWITGKLTSGGAGGNYGEVRLYATSYMYTGTQVLQPGYLYAKMWAYAQITSTNNQGDKGLIAMKPGLGDQPGWIYLTLSYVYTELENTQMKLYTLDIQPEF